MLSVEEISKLVRLSRPGPQAPTSFRPSAGRRAKDAAKPRIECGLPTASTAWTNLPVPLKRATYLRATNRLTISASAPRGNAIARYPRAMSNRNSMEKTASTPNTDRVAVRTRRVSSTPLPSRRGDRVRQIANATNHIATTPAETIE